MTEEELQKQLKLAKINQIKLLVETIAKTNESFKDYAIDGDKELPYYDAMIDFLQKQKTNEIANKPKLITFDKTESERANLSPEELKQLKEDQNRINSYTDSFLATLDPRASLKGALYTNNSLILRYRGNGIDVDFAKKYPFGVML